MSRTALGNCSTVDDPVYQHLRGGHPDDAGQAMDDQQHHGLPYLSRIGHEHDAPADRHADEQQHAGLDEAANIEAIGQAAGEAARNR